MKVDKITYTVRCWLPNLGYFDLFINTDSGTDRTNIENAFYNYLKALHNSSIRIRVLEGK